MNTLKKLQTTTPYFALSAILFYLLALLLWKIGLVPSPAGIITFLQGLYENYGLLGLFIASLLEGIVYFGTYFPGSFVIALAVILSDGSFTTLLSISAIVSCALTLAAAINYLIGKSMAITKKTQKEIEKKHPLVTKGLFASMLHPVSLGFYFFRAGLKHEHTRCILIVPLFMIPYGMLIGVITYGFKELFWKSSESPYTLLVILGIWLIVEWTINLSKK